MWILFKCVTGSEIPSLNSQIFLQKLSLFLIYPINRIAPSNTIKNTMSKFSLLLRSINVINVVLEIVLKHIKARIDDIIQEYMICWLWNLGFLCLLSNRYLSPQ